MTEEKDTGASQTDDATTDESVNEDATQEETTAPTAQAESTPDDSDDDEIDYDSVSGDEIETGEEDEVTEVEDDEEDAEEEDAEPEYTTGVPPGDVERNSGLGAAAGQPELADALGSLQSVDESERKEVVGGRSYELIFIVRAAAADAVDEITQNVQNIVEAQEGAIDHVRKSELRRLAYPIKKENEGFYVVTNGRYRQETIPELERMLKLEERILRFMFIRQEK